MDRDLRQEVAEGLLYAHSRLNANASKTLEAASFLYALVELLSESDLVDVARKGMLQVHYTQVETGYTDRLQ